METENKSTETGVAPAADLLSTQGHTHTVPCWENEKF